jgi:hypothetical protein
VAIEVTGNGGALDGVLDCMARFGRVALLGCTRSSDFTIDYYRKVHGPGITLIGAHTNARPQYESHHGWWTTADDIRAVKTTRPSPNFSAHSAIACSWSGENTPAMEIRRPEKFSVPRLRRKPLPFTLVICSFVILMAKIFLLVFFIDTAEKVCYNKAD